MTTERDVRSLGEDIQKMILGGYTSFIEGIALQDEDLAWELADKYADQLRSMVRTTFADLEGDASEGLKKPPKRKRKGSYIGKAVLYIGKAVLYRDSLRIG